MYELTIIYFVYFVYFEYFLFTGILSFPNKYHYVYGPVFFIYLVYFELKQHEFKIQNSKLFTLHFHGITPESVFFFGICTVSGICNTHKIDGIYE